MAVIVAAEDDADVAGLLATTLSRAGHVVHLAGNGPRALQMVAECHPDLVILDNGLPGMTGLDVARRLRADDATAAVPMMMLTAVAPDGARDVFDQVLSKPVPFRQVADVARDLLANSGDRRLTSGRPLTDPDRLAAVARLLDEPDPVDELSLAIEIANVAELTGASSAVAGLVLDNTLQHLASVGLPDLIVEAGGTPIEWTPGGVLAGTDRPVLFDDLSSDPIFQDIPMVTMSGVRSYAGVPLHSPDGLVVGIMAVMDTAPMRFSGATVDTLRAAAPRVMRLIDRRR
ncbi:response regulator [Actinoplanes sp. NPDC026619]|uniref:response regulator n=1 Tax=Actinoplanes sp. NPDC026619 TaxID=3155798 RepID=UPI0033E92740